MNSPRSGLVTMLATSALVILPLTNPRLTRIVGPRGFSNQDPAAIYAPHQKEFWLTADEIGYIRPGLKITVNSITIGDDRKAVVDLSYADDPVSPSTATARSPRGRSRRASSSRGGTPRRATTRPTPPRADEPDHRRDRHAGRHGHGRDLHGHRPRPRDVQVQDGSGRLTTSRPRRRSASTRPATWRTSRTRTTRQRRARLRAQRSGGHAGLGQDRPGRMQHLPQPAVGPRRRAAGREALRPLPLAPDDGSGHGQHGRLQSDDPQDPPGREPPERAGGDAVRDHRLPAVRRRLLRRRLPAGRPQLRHLPCRSGHAGDQLVRVPRPGRLPSCHDDVNFVTGENHPAGAQADDSQCSCLQPAGGHDWDASVRERTRCPIASTQLKGLNAQILSVTNAAPGQKPTVTFQLTENDGTPSSLRRRSRRT